MNPDEKLSCEGCHLCGTGECYKTELPEECSEDIEQRRRVQTINEL